MMLAMVLIEDVSAFLLPLVVIASAATTTRCEPTAARIITKSKPMDSCSLISQPPWLLTKKLGRIQPTHLLWCAAKIDTVTHRIP